MGYLQKLMLQETLFTGFEEKNFKKLDTRNVSKSFEENIKEKMKELEELKVFYYETQNQIINEFLLTNNDEKNRLLEFIQLNTHYDKNINLEKNLKDRAEKM